MEAFTATERVPHIAATARAFERPLRIGVMLDSLDAPRWVEKILRDIAAAPFLDLVLVVVDATGSPEVAAPRSWRDRLARQRAALPHRLWEWYQAADYRRCRDDRDDPFTTVDVTPLTRGAVILPVAAQRKKFIDRFAQDDVDQIGAAGLDVMLRFGFRVIKGGILGTARFGVWSFHHDDNRTYRGGPALFWEMYEGNPTSGTVLQVLTEQLDGGKVIYRSISSTDFSSLYKNRAATYWKTSEFMVRRLADLWQHGWEYLTSLETYGEPDSYRRGIFRRPTNRQMLRFLARTFVHRIRLKLLDQIDERWVIGYRRRDISRNPSYSVVTPPAGRFYADPFVAEHDGRTYVFFEACSTGGRDGVIECVEIRPDGSVTAPQRVLECAYHLSYPSVFRWNGGWYMVPETGDNRTVEIYKALEFPHRWRRESILLDDVDARDATLFEWDGRWWMFVTLCVPGGPRTDELSLFYADSPLGPWQPHPRNPIVSDVTRARAAGAVYVEGGAIIRPGQDCSRGYGYAVVLNRIDVLNDREYHETPLTRILPTWHRRLVGTHTINHSDQFEVTDGRLRRYVLRRDNV
jgi:hypothetical protein